VYPYLETLAIRSADASPTLMACPAPHLTRSINGADIRNLAQTLSLRHSASQDVMILPAKQAYFNSK